MTDEKPRHYGDPIMLLRIEDSTILSSRAKNSLENDNVVFIADLLQHSEASLLRIPNFGRKCLNEVSKYLHSLRSDGKEYKLPETHEYENKFHGNEEKIKEYYGLHEPQQRPSQEMRGYAEKSFTSVSAYIEDDNVIYAFTLSDEFANLVRDGHIQPDSDDFISTFFNHALCDSPSFVDNEGCTPKIELAYNQNSDGEDMSGLLRLAHVNVRQGFIDAVNYMLPVAMERAEKDWRKRYGIIPS